MFIGSSFRMMTLDLKGLESLISSGRRKVVSWPWPTGAISTFGPASALDFDQLESQSSLTFDPVIEPILLVLHWQPASPIEFEFTEGGFMRWKASARGLRQPESERPVYLYTRARDLLVRFPMFKTRLRFSVPPW